MISRIKKWFTSAAKTEHDKHEQERKAAMEAVARDIDSLRERKDKAVTFLSARDKRNHWGESVADMILGSKS